MTSDAKIVALILGSTLIIVFSAAIINGKSSFSPASARAQVSDSEIANGITVTPQSFNAGNIPYNSGITKLVFIVKNNTNTPAKLTRITTSCMCTKAALKVGPAETKFFSMNMTGIPNPDVDIDISAGGEAQLMVNFDPAAHGPQGVGPFNRVVHLNFTNPLGFVDVSFDGVVTK